MRAINKILGKLFAFVGVVVLVGSPVIGGAIVYVLKLRWWHALWIIPLAVITGLALVTLSAVLFAFIEMLDDPSLSFAHAWTKVKKDNAPPPMPSPDRRS